jgi:hypothetical protein
LKEGFVNDIMRLTSDMLSPILDEYPSSLMMAKEDFNSANGCDEVGMSDAKLQTPLGPLPTVT